PEVPEALEALIARMLSKEPGARPEDGAAVYAALTGLGGSSQERHDARPAALTGQERRLFCLILIRSGEEALGELTALPRGDRAASLPELRAMASPYGATLEPLADGSVMAVFSGEGEIADVAREAARCALALMERFPEAPMALTMGTSAEGPRGLPVGEIID